MTPRVIEVLCAPKQQINDLQDNACLRQFPGPNSKPVLANFKTSFQFHK